MGGPKRKKGQDVGWIVKGQKHQKKTKSLGGAVVWKSNDQPHRHGTTLSPTQSPNYEVENLVGLVLVRQREAH